VVASWYGGAAMVGMMVANRRRSGKGEGVGGGLGKGRKRALWKMIGL